jgi:glycosyltransferase involved in cell wall biosynthesis
VWVDATFAGLLAEYHSFAGLDRATVRDGNAIEARAFERVDAAIFSSRWARATAIDAYDLDPMRAHVVPFGANIDLPTEATVETYIRARSTDRIELAFIGVIWEGKGGPLALETARLLNESGIPTRLTVVGVTPALDGPAPEWLECTGMLDKGTAEGRATFARVLARAHVLVFPTRFDAYGLAIAEANAYGVPAVAPCHAGPATIIRDGRNGALLERDATAGDYHDAVLQMWGDSHAYRALARSSHHECRDRLSWASASRRVLEILTDVSGC